MGTNSWSSRVRSIRGETLAGTAVAAVLAVAATMAVNAAPASAADGVSYTATAVALPGRAVSVAVDPGLHLAVVTLRGVSGQDSGISLVDTATDTVVETFPLPVGLVPVDVVVDESTHLAYAYFINGTGNGLGEGAVLVVDLVQRSITRTAYVEWQATEVEIDHASHRLVVAAFAEGTFSTNTLVVETTGFSTVATFDGVSGNLSVNQGNGLAYGVGDGSVVEFVPATASIVRTVPVSNLGPDGFIWDVAADDSSGAVYVTSFQVGGSSQQLQVIEPGASSSQVVRDVPVTSGELAVDGPAGVVHVGQTSATETSSTEVVGLVVVSVGPTPDVTEVVTAGYVGDLDVDDATGTVVGTTERGGFQGEQDRSLTLVRRSVVPTTTTTPTTTTVPPTTTTVPPTTTTVPPTTTTVPPTTTTVPPTTTTVPPTTTSPPTTTPPAVQTYYRFAYTDTLSTVSGGEVRPATFAQWQAAGFPSPQLVASRYERYSFSPTLFAESSVPGVSKPVLAALSGAEWAKAGRPAASTVGFIDGSLVYQFATGGAELFLRLPITGEVHKLTFAEWSATGFARQLILGDNGFFKLTWDATIAYANSIGEGDLQPISAARWASEAFPTPQVQQRFAGDVFTQACGTATIHYTGPTLDADLSFVQWVAAGSPAPARPAACSP